MNGIKIAQLLNTLKVMVLFFMVAASGVAVSLPAQAMEYKIDTKGAHAFVQFRIKHLGYSWLYGRFDRFGGNFTFDESKPEDSSIQVVVDTTSINSNHVERDKHLRGKGFLDVSKYPKATFISQSFKPLGKDTYKLTGNLTLHGVTKPITIDVQRIGGGKDPWGGQRQGFTGRTKFKLKDFGINYDLGPASTVVELILDIEGVN